MRITNFIREGLSKNIVNNKFDDKINTVKLKMRDIIEKILSKEIEGLPFKAVEGYVSYTSTAFVKNNDHRYSKRIAITLSKNYPRKLNADFVFYIHENKTLEKLHNKYYDIKEVKEQSLVECERLLRSVNTEKQLFAALPEIEPLFTRLYGSGQDKNNLLPVDIKTINSVKLLLT